MTFLPSDYEPPISNGSNYLKLNKGENIVRFIGKPIVGHVWWEKERGSDVPKRCRKFAEINNPDPTNKAKHFWACCVWNYELKKIQIWEFTQRSIQEGVQNLIDDQDWGDPRNYDIKIIRSGESLETKYSVSPRLKSDIPEPAQFEFDIKDIKLEKLYTGDDPFEG
tara:strand:- start:80 stop:577 length:498 start_codon:yes stop_codon:yes gene_type:complete